MNPLAILLVMLHVLRVKTTIQEFFDITQEANRKYFELIEVTAEIINQNVIESSSNHVAIIGVINEHYVSDKILEKISIPIASPSEIHGLSKIAIIFTQNFSEILIEEDLNHIYRRGRIITCVTILNSKKNEFLKEFTKVASDLWINRFSQFIFIVWIEDELNIYGIQPYAERTCFPAELTKIETAESGKVLKEIPIYKKIRNLNECLLRVITTTGMPYAETVVENNVTVIKGIEGNILNVLSKSMNFTTLISDTEKLLYFDSRFNDSKDRLRSNESDLCFAGKKVNIYEIEPTVSIMDCQKIWIVPKAQLITPWMHVIIPFEKSVWIMLVIALFFIGLICLFLNEKIFSLISMWSLFLGVSVEMKKTPSREFMKLLLAIWILFSYVITRSYLASLEGYLTKPKFFPEINTLEELVASGIPIEGHPIVGKLFCPNNESAVSRDICNRFRPRSFETIFRDIKLKGKLERAFSMKAAIYKNSKFLRDYETHAMKEILLKYPTAFLAQQGAPFLDEMNNIITRLIETGFIDLWQKGEILIQHKKKHYPKKLRVEHILGIMFVATLGYAISIIVFCVEYSVSYFDFSKLRNTFKGF